MKNKLIKLLDLLTQEERNKDIIEVDNSRTSIANYLEELRNESINMHGKIQVGYITEFNSRQSIIYKKRMGIGL